MVLQCPRLRIIDDSDLMNCSSDSVPARTSSDSRHTSVPQPSAWPRNVPVSIGPPGTTTAGRSTDAAAISKRGDRLVAATEQHDAVDRVGPQHLLDGHRGHVAPQHRGRADQRLAERHDRQVERDPARLVDALLDALGDLVEMGVARRQIGGGVGDRDVRAAVEGVRGQAAPHPGSVDVGVAVGAGVPLRAALLSHGRRFHRRDAIFRTMAHVRHAAVLVAWATHAMRAFVVTAPDAGASTTSPRRSRAPGRSSSTSPGRRVRHRRRVLHRRDGLPAPGPRGVPDAAGSRVVRRRVLRSAPASTRAGSAAGSPATR